MPATTGRRLMLTLTVFMALLTIAPVLFLVANDFKAQRQLDERLQTNILLPGVKAASLHVSPSQASQPPRQPHQSSSSSPQPSTTSLETQPNIQKPKSRFAILVIAMGNETYKARSIENKAAYAHKHNYDLIIIHNFTQVGLADDGSQRPAWAKIAAIQMYLPRYYWIWSIDLDAFVVNDWISLESIVRGRRMRGGDGKPSVKRTELIVSTDCNGINAGSMLVKNSPESVERVRQWMLMSNTELGSHGFLEQGVLSHFYEKDMYGTKAATALVPARVFNSYPDAGCGRKQLFQEGDFVVHFVGGAKPLIGPFLDEGWRHVDEDEEKAVEVKED